MTFDNWWAAQDCLRSDFGGENIRLAALAAWNARQASRMRICRIRQVNGRFHAELRDGDKLVIGADLVYILAAIHERGYNVEGVN